MSLPVLWSDLNPVLHLLTNWRISGWCLMVRWGGVAATFIQIVRVMTPRLLTVLRIRSFVKLIEFGVRKQVWWVNIHSFVANFIGYATTKNFWHWVIFSQVFAKVKRVSLVEGKCRLSAAICTQKIQYLKSTVTGTVVLRYGWKLKHAGITRFLCRGYASDSEYNDDVTELDACKVVSKYASSLQVSASTVTF